MASEWTIETLKEHLELKFRSLDALRAAEARALILQAEEYERRLEGLNGEQARIATNQSASVSRELWESTQREDRDWKRRIEGQVADRISREEFQTYKEATERALTLRAGQSQGISAFGGIIFQLFTSLTGIAAIVTVLILFLKH